MGCSNVGEIKLDIRNWILLRIALYRFIFSARMEVNRIDIGIFRYSTMNIDKIQVQ